MTKRKNLKGINPYILKPENTESTAIAVRPRIIAVCKAYNIAHFKVFNFLEARGYQNLNANSLLDANALQLVIQNFRSGKRGKIVNKFIDPKTTLDSKSTEDNSSKEIDLDKNKQPVLHLVHDIFKKSKQDLYLKGYQTLSSNFSDKEAINICSKMSSSFTRKLCKQLYDSKVNRKLILYQLHYIANKALRIFGSKILTFIYALRNLNFKNQTASEIQTYAKVIPDFPIISFDTGNTLFKISFFVKRREKEKKLRADIRLFAPTTYEEIGTIDEEGYIMGKLEKFKPQLTLFYQSTKSNDFKIFSGVETGNCEICGRELSHPVSLRIGIGPTCASNRQIDRMFYDFG